MKLPYVNRTIFAGYVGNDVELRHLSSGDAVVSLRIKSQHSYRVEGVWKSIDEWATAVFYRQLATAVVEQGIRKGSFIHLEGRRHTRQFTTPGRNKPGVAHEIIVEDWHQVQLPNAARPEQSIGDPSSDPADSQAADTPRRIEDWKQYG